MSWWFFNQFESSEFCLPGNVTWNDVLDNGDFQFPRAWALLNKLSSVIGLLFVARCILINFVFLKWGFRLNVKSGRSKKAPLCPQLEELYLKDARATRSPGRVKRVSEATGLTPEQVLKWFEIRRLQDEASDLDKFIEDCWTTVYSVVLFFLGWYSLIDEPKLWGWSTYWINYPFQRVQVQHEWFYVLTMAFLVIESIVLAIKKQETLDLNLRIYHHVFALLLLAVAWTANEIRLGILLLYMPETLLAPFAHASKVAEWLNWSKTSQVLFGISIALWLVVGTIWFHAVALPFIFLYCHLHFGDTSTNLLLDILLAQLVIANSIWIKMFVTKILTIIWSGHHLSKTRIDDSDWMELTKAIYSAQENSK